MATYYEELLKRIENVDAKGQTGMPYSKELTADYGAPVTQALPTATVLKTPDGRVFGASNYTPPPARQRMSAPAAPAAPATPAVAALSTMTAPMPPMPGAISPLPATPAAPLVAAAPTNTGLPGSFGGRAAIGSAGWWTDGKGGNTSVLPPGMDTTEAEMRLARVSEIDRINREAEKRMTGGRVSGAARPARESYDKRLMKAQAEVEKDREQLSSREGAIGKALGAERDAQALMSSWKQMQEAGVVAKKKKKKDDEEEES